MKQNEKYLTTDEVLEKLKISRVTLWRLVKYKKIKRKKLGGLNRYKLSDIENIMK